jgi:dTDP-glucose 4,6-dehydratase
MIDIIQQILIVQVSWWRRLRVAYENTYGLPIYITHTMNVFGERQHPEKYIPMCIRKIRDGESIMIHSDATKTIPGSRHYIHAEDVASSVLFLLNYSGKFKITYGDIRCPKFNIIGAEELNNLELAQIIAQVQKKELKYELVDFHSLSLGMTCVML